MSKTMLQRFEEKYCPEPNTGCWLWTAGVNNHGYGCFGVEHDRVRLAHRVAWLIYIGPIPAGNHYGTTCVLHQCDQPLCVNPDHLFLGSQRDNIVDMYGKQRGRSSAGRDNPNVKLTEEQVIEIYFAQGEQEQIAREYGVGQTTVSSIKLRKTWKRLLAERLVNT